jgi:putative membrane protein
MPVRSLCFAALAAAACTAFAQPGPTDPQIAAIVVTANQVDIDAGRLAEGRTHAAGVRQFARQMVTDHTAVNRQATDLVHRLKVRPEPNATSASLKKGGDENIARLEKLHGPAFDKAYVEHEVDYHQAVLDALDKTLIPSASNAQLKELLEKVRPAIAAHLAHAQHLQMELGR